MSDLFRREAVQAQQQLWLGRIQVAQPLALRWLAAGAAVVALVIGGFLSLAHYTRKAEMPGLLVASGADVQAVLYAPGRAIGLLRPGQSVRLRFEAYPYPTYGHRDGRVLAVSRVPLAAAEQAELRLPAAPGAGEPRFRVTVALEPASTAALPLVLEPGMRLQADVRLERRRLIEWLFEPRSGLQTRS